MKKVVPGFVWATIALFLSISTAGADTLTWYITSQYPYSVQLEFYSESDPGRAWPGNGLAYEIRDYATHEYHLNCWTGEKICYGAWATGNASIYWGSGYNNSQSCSSCCAVCSTGSVNKTLTD